MITLGILGITVYILLGIATAATLGRDAVHEFRRWRIDRLRAYRLPLASCRVVRR